MEGTLALVVTAVFFALGSLIGAWSALRMEAGAVSVLEEYMSGFLTAAEEGSVCVPGLAPLLWRTLRWPLAAFLMGFTALGLAGLPLLSALRGFFLTFSVSAFARAYGRSGLKLAFSLLGISGILTIPAFFLLTAQSFSAALRLAASSGGQARRDLPYHSGYFLRCAACAAAFGAAILLERSLIPMWVVYAVSLPAA